MENYKAKDKEAIIAYIKGKESVNVEDIIKEAGAEELRVYPILFELERDGEIEVIERDGMGAGIAIRKIKD